MILHQSRDVQLDRPADQAIRLRIGLIGVGSIVGLLAMLNLAASLA